MANEYEFFINKQAGKTYISSPFNVDTQQGRMRFATKVFDSPEIHGFFQIKDELVLRITRNQRQEIRATFYEDSREIRSLQLQRFTRKTGEPHQSINFTFQGDEISELLQFLRAIKYIDLKDGKSQIDDADLLDELEFSDQDKLNFLHNNIELVKEIAQNGITKSDVIALAYRKEQLDIFERLLTDDNFFESTKLNWGKRGSEAVWQSFFENNAWIFGYGLDLVFASPLDDKNLEQIVAGTLLDQSGKRVDALMKTKGLISSLCFIEIKTHKTKLLHHKEYRSECWSMSNELAGSVAQIQKTVQKAVKSIGARVDLHNKVGDPTGEQAFLYQPKSYVVVGNLAEFQTDHGINEQKFSSFELFRQNLTNPEIITFDELLERAKFIVQHSEYASNKQYNLDNHINEDDEIPF